MTGAKRLGLLLLLTWVGSFSARAQDPDEKGPVRSLAQVTVPSCVGLLGGKGRAALEAVGLKWQYAPQGIPTGDVARNATVAAQEPAAGQRVARGSTVTLTLYVFVEPQPDEKGRVKLPRR